MEEQSREERNETREDRTKETAEGETVCAVTGQDKEPAGVERGESAEMEEPDRDSASESSGPDEERAEAVIEAILFTMGDTVEISKLAEVVGCGIRTVKRILGRMEERYAAGDRGIMLTRFENAVQLCTKPEMYDYLIRIAKNPRKLVLTDTVIETLSIIAYKQPVTRLDVESIRGVNCDHAINKLLEYDLITELGRLDAPGRPILFGTTEQFLRCFGVRSLEELPELSTVQLEEFKAQAEAEIQIKLDI